MIATIVLASFLCTVDSNNAEKCETAYEEVYAGTDSEYRRDAADCVTILNQRYPEEVTLVPDDRNKFLIAGCYRVLPGQWVGLSPKEVYLQNLQDADDSFKDKMQRLELN